jgi:cytochrome P450/glutathione S-transferase
LTAATIYHPRMISVAVSPYCELARWVLDRLGIPYVEECHAPVFNVLAAQRYGGGSVVPILDTGETALLDARAVVDYYEARAPQNLKLYPADSALETEARQLFDFLFDTFGVAVRAWAYAYMLPERSRTIRAWVSGAPWWERLAVPVIYPLLAAALRKNLQLQPDSVAQQQPIIESALSQIEARLADGRRFLMGDTLTAPDLAFAALSAPIMIPPQYGGPMPALDQLPRAMRSTVESWRARPSGRFVLRLYESRPEKAPDLVALGKHGSGRTLKDKLLNFAISPGILRPVFTFLRRFSPILLLGKHAIVTRNDDVIEVLKRDTDFTIRQINAPKIDQIGGPFILGMDASPQFDRENAMLHEVVRRDDLENIRQFVAQSAGELVAAARPHRRIDVVNGLARVVAIRLVASYFGMPGPNDPTMMRWMRDIFHYIFADLTNGEDVKRDALHASVELHGYMDHQIALRKSQPSDGSDDVLGRLLALQGAGHPWLDDLAVRRNLAGVIVGAVDTTSKFVALAMDELLRRPERLAKARECALKGDIEGVRRYAWEAVRFNPHHPLQVRYCAQAAQIAQGQSRAEAIPPDTLVYVATLSAMFDGDVFTKPDEFNPQRQTEYLHFGYGMHACFGKAINGIQIPELLAALLRLQNLRRAPGSAGQILYDGPFPNRFVLEFDA